MASDALASRLANKQSGGMLKRSLFVLLALIVLVAVVMFFWQGNSSNHIADVTQVQPLAASDAPSMQAIPQTDLPPEGTRSLFDFLVANNDGLSYPFTELLADINAQNPNASMLETVLIPDGRSLLKAHANFAQPRVIVAVADNAPNTNFELGPMLKGRLFMGFVEAANEIEVISYNDNAGRFEYQLVKNYCEGCTPKIVYAKRALCTTCHSNQATIFSVRPWEETNAQPAISDAIAAERGDQNAYAGAPIVSTLDTAEAVDNLTEIANTITTTQRLWLDGCGRGEAGQACRGNMLKLALQYAANPGLFNTNSMLARTLQQQQAVQWPAEGIVHASADIASRDPFSTKAHGGGLRGLINSYFGQNVLTENPGANDIEAFDKLPPLPAELDPLSEKPVKATYRADSLEGVFGIAQLFSQQDLATLQSEATIETLQAAVDHVAVQSHLDAKPFSRVAMMNALLTALGRSPLQSRYSDTSELSEPLLDGEPPLKLAANSPLQPFQQYCFACHRGNPSARLNFMSGASEAEVLANIKVTDAIYDVLEYDRYLGTEKANTLMPPRNSWQRLQLDAAIADGETPHEDMQEVVPSLLDF